MRAGMATAPDLPRGGRALVHHDDDTDRGDPPYEKGAEKALTAADQHGFTAVSVRDDWAEVFPSQAT
jgi:hypothetical protein